MTNYRRNNDNSCGGLFIFFFLLALFLAWLTHVIYCLGIGAWGFLLAGAVFFPIGIIHGIGLWFGIF